MSDQIWYRAATEQDVEPMCAFILTHGQNQWNYLPEDGIHAYLAGLVWNGVLAHMAFCGKELVGFIAFHLCQACTHSSDPHGHLTELVVHPEFREQGIGTQLTKAAMASLSSMSMQTTFAERHEENVASARVLEKAGFEIASIYFDPHRRSSGTRSTAVSFYRLVRACG